MNKEIYLLLGLFLSSGYISTKIIEIGSFNDVGIHIAKNTLIILDIDDTLLIPRQMVGTDVWFLAMIDEYQKQGQPKNIALQNALAMWEGIRHLTQIQIVEPGTEKIVQEWQNSGYWVMGLSTQSLTLSERTTKQLNSLAIDLSKTSPALDDVFFVNHHQGILFHKGTLFTGGTPKGEALIKLLGMLAYAPDHILFVNDKEAHLVDVGNELEKHGIPFTGLRYSHSDRRVNSFRKEIADIQFAHSSLHKILSDEEAQSLLNECNS